jgi:hypothetical protein
VWQIRGKNHALTLGNVAAHCLGDEVDRGSALDVEKGGLFICRERRQVGWRKWRRRRRIRGWMGTGYEA